MTAAAAPRIVGYMRGRILAMKQPGIKPHQVKLIAKSAFSRGLFLQEDKEEFIKAFFEGYKEQVKTSPESTSGLQSFLRGEGNAA